DYYCSSYGGTSTYIF
nr:immunoglobulin light chain junction region [Macaca mulatta]MOY15110.1 immunoglobulin light chain junction region [Macaca mulatta]MOY17863.1 immunoglobulin light chain junction region [Macaca mulatta]